MLFRNQILKMFAKRKLKIGKKSKAKSILKKTGVLPDFHEESDEYAPCEFCSMKYCSVGLHCVQRGEWTRCQK